MKVSTIVVIHVFKHFINQCHFNFMPSQEIFLQLRLNEDNFVCKLCSSNTIGILESVLDHNKMSS